MRLPSNTTLEDFVRHHQPEPDSPLSWLVEKCDALQAERDRLVEALEQYVWACQERDRVIDLALDALDRAAITEAREHLDSIDTTEEDLPNTDEWGID
jgi:hypothetical protein